MRDPTKTTWRGEIVAAMTIAGESFKDLIDCTLEEGEWDRPFDPSYGGVEGEPFTLWTASRVYFPVQYDGSEWVESVPRNPCAEKTPHVGGG